jgi:hypothetical protein
MILILCKLIKTHDEGSVCFPDGLIGTFISFVHSTVFFAIPFGARRKSPEPVLVNIILVSSFAREFVIHSREKTEK